MSSASMTPTTDQLKDLLDKVTPGEWYIDGCQVTSDTLHEMDCIVDHVYGTEANATLIALAPTLAAEVVRLRAIIERVDQCAPVADETCDESGITFTEAIMRQWPVLHPPSP